MLMTGTEAEDAGRLVSGACEMYMTCTWGVNTITHGEV